MSFSRRSKGLPNVMLGGEIEWKGCVGVHVYSRRPLTDRYEYKREATAVTDGKGSGGGKGLEYTVYGQFSNTLKENGLLLANLVPELKGTLMEDVMLEKAAVIIASCNDGQLGPLNKSGYSIR